MAHKNFLSPWCFCHALDPDTALASLELRVRIQPNTDDWDNKIKSAWKNPRSAKVTKLALFFGCGFTTISSFFSCPKRGFFLFFSSIFVGIASSACHTLFWGRWENNLTINLNRNKPKVFPLFPQLHYSNYFEPRIRNKCSTLKKKINQSI